MEIEDIEEQLFQKADTIGFGNARRVGAMKTLALKEMSNEYWIAVCAA